MQKEKIERIGLNPTLNDFAIIERIAAAQRRNPTDVMRMMFEDWLDGRVNIDDALSTSNERKTAGVRVPAAFKAAFDARRGDVSADKVLHALVDAAANVEQGGAFIRYVDDGAERSKNQ